MNEKYLTAEAFQTTVDSLPPEARMYLRLCFEAITRCFMDETPQVGLLLTSNSDTGETEMYSLGLDHHDVTVLLSQTLASRMADVAAMNTPKEKLN